LEFFLLHLYNITMGGKFLVLMGMAGIGLNTDLKRMVKIGVTPFVTGFIASTIVAVISLIIMIWVVGIKYLFNFSVEILYR